MEHHCGGGAAVSRWSWNAKRSSSLSVGLSLVASPVLHPHICTISGGRGGEVADISSKLVNFYRALGPVLVARCWAGAGRHLCDSSGTQITLGFELWCLPQGGSSAETLEVWLCLWTQSWFHFQYFTIRNQRVQVGGGSCRGIQKHHQENTTNHHGAQVDKRLALYHNGKMKTLRLKLGNVSCCWFPLLIWCQLN